MTSRYETFFERERRDLLKIWGARDLERFDTIFNTFVTVLNNPNSGLNFADVEEAFRKNDLPVFLVAWPVPENTQYMAVLRSQECSHFVEVHLYKADAEKRLHELGLTPQENMRNLGHTGFLTRKDAL